MTTNVTELSMENMELANGGFSPVACVLGTLFGAEKAPPSAVRSASRQVPWAAWPERSSGASS